MYNIGPIKNKNAIDYISTHIAQDILAFSAKREGDDYQAFNMRARVSIAGFPTDVRLVHPCPSRYIFVFPS